MNRADDEMKVKFSHALPLYISTLMIGVPSHLITFLSDILIEGEFRFNYKPHRTVNDLLGHHGSHSFLRPAVYEKSKVT